MLFDTDGAVGLEGAAGRFEDEVAGLGKATSQSDGLYVEGVDEADEALVGFVYLGDELFLIGSQLSDVVIEEHFDIPSHACEGSSELM